MTERRPLPRPVKRALARQDTENFVSVVTAWEIAVKHSLRLSMANVKAAIEILPATLLPIKFIHLEELSKLADYADHRDPFDRMLIAQAISEDLTIVSADTRFEKYKKLRVLWD
jgi:PIN domain nuclease of toxin-antitoxin system